MSDGRGYRVGVGAPSLIMVLVVLCLTVLGLLSLSVASSELELTERGARSMEAYYEANGRAQEALSRVDALLLSARAEAAGDPARYDGLVAGLRDPDGVFSVAGGVIGFTIAVDDVRSLDVAVRPNALSDALRYRVIRYALTTADEPLPDGNMNLLSEARMCSWT